ncbi:pyridoxamine 5'-phosphate oxidase family protein [Mycobacterium sp. 050272]|uniref:pyridoxamine 5'-phosphate oxidase family protein n=1 Tax=Mycobacterium sp. 050272 TaxID=3142488 RepID=UPI0031898DE4
MATWTEFAEQAPRIADIFTRRHRATGNLCMLATLRADGFPRISPMEPRIFEDQLWLPGMPGTTKFADLLRDPRFCLHTATVDNQLADGDAKLWGFARECSDSARRERFVEDLAEDTGLDLRGEDFAFFGTEITGASAIELRDERLNVTVWKPGQPERVVPKH